MIGLMEGSPSEPNMPSGKNLMKVMFYEWLNELGKEDNMRVFNILSDIARGKFRDYSIAEAVTLIDRARGGRPKDCENCLPEEMSVLDRFIEAHQSSAQGLTAVELRDFIMEYVYGLT